ncbi:MAG: hypothetical protein IJU78_07165 [Clostridia bacterium]|nr:hypothetical protein [Clostridia bacterium]
MSKRSGLGTALPYRRIIVSALAGFALAALAMFTVACLIDLGKLSAGSMPMYAYLCVFAGEFAAAMIAPAEGRRLLCSLLAGGVMILLLAAAGMLFFFGGFDMLRVLITAVVSAAVCVLGSIVSSYIR